MQSPNSEYASAKRSTYNQLCKMGELLADLKEDTETLYQMMLRHFIQYFESKRVERPTAYIKCSEAMTQWESSFTLTFNAAPPIRSLPGPSTAQAQWIVAMASLVHLHKEYKEFEIEIERDSPDASINSKDFKLPHWLDESVMKAKGCICHSYVSSRKRERDPVETCLALFRKLLQTLPEKWQALCDVWISIGFSSVPVEGAWEKHVLKWCPKRIVWSKQDQELSARESLVQVSVTFDHTTTSVPQLSDITCTLLLKNDTGIDPSATELSTTTHQDKTSVFSLFTNDASLSKGSNVALEEALRCFKLAAVPFVTKDTLSRDEDDWENLDLGTAGTLGTGSTHN